MDASKSFYVGIQESKDFRRNLLESSKMVVSILKRHHKIKTIRSLKKDKLNALKVHIGEITKLLDHLDEAMPDMGVRASSAKKAMALPKYEEEGFVSSSGSDELEALEAQLRDIDSRLNNI